MCVLLFQSLASFCAQLSDIVDEARTNVELRNKTTKLQILTKQEQFGYATAWNVGNPFMFWAGQYKNENM
jgi:hypothetical protein